MCLFLDFINIQYKKKIQKYIVNKTKKKKKYRKSLCKLNHNTYLLNFEDEDRTRDWEEKNREIWDWKNVEDERERKMNWRGSRCDLYYELTDGLTDGFTDVILNNIIFN
jgi:hypothetical protein